MSDEPLGTDSANASQQLDKDLHVEKAVLCVRLHELDGGFPVP